MRILVTDGENRAALAVTRSLGRAGHDVIVGEKSTPSLAQASRYCAERVVYPDPITNSAGFVDRLAELVREQRIDVLMPVADITTFLVTRHRDRFGPSCAVPFADADVVDRAADKASLMNMAVRLGVPVPAFVVVSSRDEVPDVPFGFPLVVKPWKSRLMTSRGWMSSSVSYARTREALVQDLAARPDHEFPVMLQERIVGDGKGVFACYQHGHPVAYFSHRRLRERPPWGGVSVLCESAPLSPVAQDFATRLLDELGWHGVAMVEFKQDVRDGQPKLMEINGRFWGSLQLAIDAGVDFPALLLQVARGEAPGPQAPYRLGVRSRWLWGDVDSLLLTMRGRPGAPDAGNAHRLKAVMEFLKFKGRNLYYDNPQWDDQMPWVLETRTRLRHAVDALTTRSRRRPPAPADRAGLRPVAGPGLARRARIVTTLDETGLDEAGWNQLVAHSETNTVFQTHQWQASWCAALLGNHEPLVVTVANGSTVTGVAPMVVEQLASGDRLVRFASDRRADYCDFVAGDDKPAVVRAVFDAITDYGRWNVIQLNNLPGESTTPAIVREVCDRAGHYTLVDDHYSCLALLIEGHEESARSVYHKASLRRRENYFKRTGTLACRMLTGAREIEPCLDAFFAQHISRWSDTDSPSLFLDPSNRRFYGELTNRVAGAGWSILSVVEYNDAPIAFHYGFDYNGSVLWYKPSFDVKYAAHSPGMVLLKHLIGHAIDHRRRELDFTLGQEEFKRRFSNCVRQTVRIHVFKDRSRYLAACSRRAIRSARRVVFG